MYSLSSQDFTSSSTTWSTGNVVPATTVQYRQDRANGPISSLPGTPQPPGSNRTKQRPPRTTPDQQLSKSLSTPHLRGTIMSEAELDNKRNKLGYQRISIACAHCRRRKIRCLVAEDDPQQRCQNCIRLKKECVFYPVDQQAALDARSDSSNRPGLPAGPAPSSAVSTSPPQYGSGSFDSPSHAYPPAYPPTTQTSQSYQGVQIAANAAAPLQSDYPHHEYPYAAQVPTSQAWGTGFAGQNVQVLNVPTGGIASSYPRHSRTPDVDTAPFPRSSNTSQRTSPNAPPMEYSGAFQHQQQWQQQQQQQQLPPQPQSLRSVPQVESASFPHGPPMPSSYFQAPAMQAQQPNSRMAQMPLGRPGHIPAQQTFIMQPDQRSSSTPGMVAYHQPVPPMQQQPSWYQDPPQYQPPANGQYPPQGGYQRGAG